MSELKKGHRDACVAVVLGFKARGEYGRVLASFTPAQAEEFVDELACHVAELLVLEFEERGAIPKKEG